MEPPKIRIMNSGEDPDLDVPVADVTLPYPDYGGNGALKIPIEEAVEDETVNFTRIKDVGGAKYKYQLEFELLPVASLNTLNSYAHASVTPYDIYFQFDRWAETSSWVQVLLDLPSEKLIAGVPNSDREYYVEATIKMTEVESRI